MIAKGFTNARDYIDTITDAREVEITKLGVLELQKAIGARELSAVEVAQAFCHRAAIIHQIVNCCSEIFIDEALERAQQLDKYMEKNGKPIGPLHGIPISLKDQVDLPGKDLAIGYVSHVGQPKTEMSVLALQLMEYGAVFYVKTTVPMAMMAPETVSNLLGYTSNSLNIHLTAGGSSGGEGALIAARGSPLGFGTDIGGSIRIPANFHGLYALKPSHGRISYMHVTNWASGQECIPSVIGPMARLLEDIEFITKLVVGSQLWRSDPKVVQLPWQKPSFEKTKFTFGMWNLDNSVELHPPIVRAQMEVAKCLEQAGHKVVMVNLPNQQAAVETVWKILGADSGYEILTECNRSGEPVIPAVQKCLGLTLKDAALSVNEWWGLCARAAQLRQEFRRFWHTPIGADNDQIDAILCPVWPTTATLPNSRYYANLTCPFNLYDCASVVIPVTKASATKDTRPALASPITGQNVEVQQVESYEPLMCDGMPVCVQVVTPKLEEEKALEMAGLIQRLVKYEASGPVDN